VWKFITWKFCRSKSTFLKLKSILDYKARQASLSKIDKHFILLPSFMTEGNCINKIQKKRKKGT